MITNPEIAFAGVTALILILVLGLLRGTSLPARLVVSLGVVVSALEASETTTKRLGIPDAWTPFVWFTAGAVLLLGGILFVWRVK